MHKHELIALAAAALMTGCLAPTYHRPDAPVAASYPQGGVYETQPDTSAAARSA